MKEGPPWVELSPEATAMRRPLPVEVLLAGVADIPFVPTGRGRPVKLTRKIPMTQGPCPQEYPCR